MTIFINKLLNQLTVFNDIINIFQFKIQAILLLFWRVIKNFIFSINFSK